jgi:heptaprenyl diphosphate synthase
MAPQLPKQFAKVADRTLMRSIESKLEIVEAGIEKIVSSDERVISDLAGHLSRAGGKRMRPVLVLLTAHLANSEGQDLIDAAIVMEVTHLATLYHDDVMDQAPLRRGVETAHMVWNNNMAILAGDLLFARASRLVASLGERALAMQAATFERLVLGQLHETIGPAQGDDALEHYISVMRDKTGSLIALSAQLGVLLSGADESYLAAVGEFGESIGVAFQLMDDIIDIQSEQDNSGKNPGTDLLAGVPTLPVLLLRESTDHESKALLQKIDAGLTLEVLPSVVAELRANSVMQRAQLAANDWANRAIRAIDPLPEGSVKSALVAFAEAVVDRKG